MFGCRRVAWSRAMWRRAGCAFALGVLLAGCAGTVPGPITSNAPPAAPVITYQEAIDLAGRLTVRYQKNGQDEALHGNFNWSQTPSRTEVTLASPLGQTLASIEVTPGHSTLIQSGQEPRSATDIDRLAAETLGWPLPVSGLRKWLQGFASDSAGFPFIAAPQAASSSVTTSDGWRIQYQSWDDEGHPKRIDLTRSTPQAGEVAIRIVVDSRQVR